MTILAPLLSLQFRPALPFPVSPGKGSNFPLDGLRAMDVVALVKPVGSPLDERRGNGMWALQSFEVVAGSRSLAAQRLRVSLPIEGASVGRNPAQAVIPRGSTFAPPPDRTYLLLAMRPRDGRMAIHFTGLGDHERQVPPEMIDDVTVVARPGETLGVALVETSLRRLPEAISREGMILRALALSTGLETEPIYSAYPLWNRILPFSATTWDGEDPANAAKRDMVEGLPAPEFYRRALSPLLPLPKNEGAGSSAVNAWALRTRWGVPGAPARLAQALLATVSSGQEESLDGRDSPLDDLGNAGYRERVGLPQKDMLELAVRARTSVIHDLALQYVLKAPTMDDQRRLLPLLEDPYVRRRLLTKLANWNRRPDLAPPGSEAAYEAKQAEIASEWRRLISSAGASAKHP